MTREELKIIHKKYQRNSDDTSLLVYIPQLLKYIEELEENIHGMNYYISELDI